MTSKGEGTLGKREDGRRLAGDGDGGGVGDRDDGGAAVQGRRCKGGGGGGLADGSVVRKVTEKNSWPGQGVAAAAAETPVGLLPRPSVSSHSRWRRLLSFLK